MSAGMLRRRGGEDRGAAEEGQSLTVLGRMLERGDAAPDFTLDRFDGSAMSSVSLADLSGSVVVLNVVNSVDTGVSSHHSEAFGRDYGVLIKEWRALQRSLFVIDTQGRLAHTEYVPDQMDEPDYAAAVAAVSRLAG